jgi:hypothetical protein
MCITSPVNPKICKREKSTDIVTINEKEFSEKINEEAKLSGLMSTKIL